MIKKPSDIVLDAMAILHKGYGPYADYERFRFCCSALSEASAPFEDGSIEYHSYKIAKKVFELFAPEYLWGDGIKAPHIFAWFGSDYETGAYGTRMTALAFTYNILLSEGL